MSDPKTFDVHTSDGIAVGMPSGSTFYVLTSDEADYLNERVERYLKDNHFVNVSDFQDIDKMVTLELFMHRWSLWLSRGVDYYGEEVDSKVLAQQLATYSTELRQLKKNLAIDKVARDRQRGDDSIGAYLDALRQRAREFGVMRNKQFDHVIEAFMRLTAMLTFHDNCTEEERLENRVTQNDMFQVLRDEIESFNKIDEEFRTTSQTMWVRKM